MAILTHSPLLLRELRYAAPARVKVWKGMASLRSGGVEVCLQEGEAFTVPPFVRFSCMAYPRLAHGASRAAVWSLALEAQAGAAMESAADASKPWARRLAQAIFAAPADDWRAVRVAARWHCTPAQLRARLFAEGESLRSLVREQRVAWALAQMADIGSTGVPACFATAGFASASALARACLDAIGLPPDLAGRAIALVSGNASATVDGRQRRYRPYF